MSEIFFIAQKGVSLPEKEKIYNLIEREFIIGHNYYIFNLLEFGDVILSLVGEMGRHDLLIEIGNQLNRHSDIAHRRSWAKILRNI